jgi:transposase-like protein
MGKAIFKRNAVAQISERDYRVSEVSKRMCVVRTRYANGRRSSRGTLGGGDRYLSALTILPKVYLNTR